VAPPSIAPAAVEREPAATVAVSRTLTSEPKAPVSRSAPKAVGKPAGDRSAWLRAWPLAVVVLGVALIAAALLIPKGPSSKPESESEPASAQSGAATTSPAIDAAPGQPQPPSVNAPQETSGADKTAQTSPATTAVTSEAGSLANTDTTAPASEPVSSLDTMEAATAPTVVDPLNEAIRLGRIDLAGQRLTSPAGTNALEHFQFALKLEPKSRSARQGIVDIAKKYIELADRNPPDKAAGAAGIVAYGQALDRAADVAKLVPEGADVLKDVSARRRKAVDPLIAQAKMAADAWDKAAAKSAYELTLQVDPENAAARDGLKFVGTIGEPGFVFRDKLADGASAPPVVVLPGAALAMARHPVTRAEFRRFWDSAGRSAFTGKEPGCRDRESIFRSSKKRSWENPDISQDDNHPVVCVSWPQAAAYAQWLAKETGKRYRLPSPAEVNQLASRAARADCATTNLADAAFNRQFESRDGSACDDGFAATSPVERFAAVEGVYDVDGNVREWVGACGNGSVAATGSSCRDFRVVGRSWLSSAKESVTFSDTYAGDVSLNSVGFRVVRDMAH
jgi:formylglycine-generating enzyme required for sulfatase activity